MQNVSLSDRLNLFIVKCFILSVFVSGVAVGKLVEKIERHIDEKENEEHIHKNDRR